VSRRLGRPLVAVALAAVTATGAGAVSGKNPRPCALLTPKLAQEAAPGVKPRPDADTAFSCDYSDGKPPAESRWSVSFEIPFRPPQVSAATLWKSEYTSFQKGSSKGRLSGLCGVRSVCGADKAFSWRTTNEGALAGPSTHVHLSWVKGRTYGHLDIASPEGRGTADCPPAGSCCGRC
jgi:hypothetical protein